MVDLNLIIENTVTEWLSDLKVSKDNYDADLILDMITLIFEKQSGEVLESAIDRDIITDEKCWIIGFNSNVLRYYYMFTIEYREHMNGFICSHVDVFDYVVNGDPESVK